MMMMRFFKYLKEEFENDTTMVKPLLEIIFSSFVTVSKTMLFDHLEGDLANPSDTLFNEGKSVPTSNVVSERDFGLLDALVKLKPKALDIVKEGVIMYKLNKTKEWRNSLPANKFKIVMDLAKESVKYQKKVFFQRKQEIHKARVAKIKSDAEEKIGKLKS